jgi:PPOX class probable F420-dependent enzyme
MPVGRESWRASWEERMGEQTQPGGADDFSGSTLSAEELREFLAGAWICKLGTLTADGYPCVNPIWYEYDGAGFTLIGRERAAWVEHIRRDPRVGLCIDDPDGAHTRVLARGRAEIVEGPSVRGPWLPVARRMAARYMGGESGAAYMERTLDFPRYTIRVTPEHLTTWRGAWARRYYR